ncbi:MAG: heme-binding protein [Zetaproteobacteria bacterium CG2_30_46_52]|nr:MAG: heme-binding protein [Zetaproteobacteria bacterium CG2_30_46_52]
MAIEEPKFEVIEQDGDYQVRLYAPKIIAEVLIDGDLDEASSKGFRLIAAYIFGENTSAKGEAEKIAMTAPVTTAPSPEKIAMTAPVTMAAAGNQYRMFFVMPSSYTMATLPKPNNAKVSLREVLTQKAAVLQFSWLAGEEKVAEKTALLQQWMKNKGLQATAPAQLARYNPPWTLPFLRRNEIIIPIE